MGVGELLHFHRERWNLLGNMSSQLSAQLSRRKYDSHWDAVKCLTKIMIAATSNECQQFPSCNICYWNVLLDSILNLIAFIQSAFQIWLSLFWHSLLYKPLCPALNHQSWYPVGSCCPGGPASTEDRTTSIGFLQKVSIKSRSIYDKFYINKLLTCLDCKSS